MSIQAIPRSLLPQSRRITPALNNGDRLTQPEFHRRYEAMPEDVRAELIGGIVYMASPLGLPHGETTVILATILGQYQAATPGVRGADNATTILGDESEPQPDLCLRLMPEFGGQSRANPENYLVGPPELIIEVAHSSEAIDLHAKKRDYQRAGVLEYLVFCIREGMLRAFDLPAGRERKIDADGIYRCRIFPGLWIDSAAVLKGDTARALKALGRGMKTAEHRAFVKQLKARGAKKNARAKSAGSRANGRRSNGRNS